MLYGENQFTIYWAHSSLESRTVDFFENIGARNKQFIRHLRAQNCTLKTFRARRSLRPILENLESLSLTFYHGQGMIRGYGSSGRSSITILRDIQRFLKTQRGPYRKLVRAFKIGAEHSADAPTLNVRLLSAKIKPGLEVGSFAPVLSCLVAHGV